MPTKIVRNDDQNTSSLRLRFPDGLHFVVGDVHGEWLTLQKLMEKIGFDPDKDHVFFVGDYNGGGDPEKLILYMALYYQEDPGYPGFHMIRGNHEWELSPVHPLKNLPDVYVIKGNYLDYYIAHAGMVSGIFDLLANDIDDAAGVSVKAYRMDRRCVEYDAPFRQIIWSRRGLYSQRSHWRAWPREDALSGARACIIHGHTPYCFFMNGYSYGDSNVFWEDQHVFFSEDLHSFDLDSNIKGRHANGESYRGLSCLCLEICEHIASQNSGRLTSDAVFCSEGLIFSESYISGWGAFPERKGEPERILNASPVMKTVCLDHDGRPVFFRQTDQ